LFGKRLIDTIAICEVFSSQTGGLDRKKSAHPNRPALLLVAPDRSGVVKFAEQPISGAACATVESVWTLSGRG
jgi:hypothetical protein